MKNMKHMTLYVYKGKEASFWVQENPYIVITVSISRRENGITTLNYYDSLYENYKLQKEGEQHSCSIEEFEQLLRDEYLFDIGAVVDGGDIETPIIH